MVLFTRRNWLVAAGTLATAGVPRNSWAQTPRGFAEARMSDAARPVPELNFTTADGTAKTLADYAGQGVVLNLWATWCIPCVAEMPDLDRLAGILGEGHAVLPLSSDRAGAPVVEAFYKQHGIAHLPVMLDPKGTVSHLLAVRGIPTTLLIDRTGQERARLEGAVEWSKPESVAQVRALVG